MTISLSSWVSTLLCSFILLLCIRIFRKKYALTTTLESKLFFFFYLLCMLRLLLPIDFYFSKGIRIKGLYSDILHFLYIRKIYIAHLEFTLLGIICFLFYLISIIKLLKLCIAYLNEKRMYGGCLTYHHPNLVSVLQQVRFHFRNLPNAEILVSSAIHSPIAIGIFRKIIVLPDICYTEEELYYVLLHEYTHFKRHDPLLKLFSNLFCCVFWWFPFMSSIRKDFSHIFEMECDSNVIKKLSRTEQLNYATTIINVLKQNISISDSSLSVSFALKESDSDIKERLHLIFHPKTSLRNSVKNVTVLVVFTFCFLCSYYFAPLTSYEPNRDEIEQDGSVFITSDNAYLILLENEYYIVTPDASPIPVPEEHAKRMLADNIPLKEDSDYD